MQVIRLQPTKLCNLCNKTSLADTRTAHPDPADAAAKCHVCRAELTICA